MKQILLILGKDVLKFINSIGLPLMLLFFMFGVIDVIAYIGSKGEHELHWYSVLGCASFAFMMIVYLPYIASKDLSIPLPQPFKTVVTSLLMWAGMAVFMTGVFIITYGGMTIFELAYNDKVTWDVIKWYQAVSAGIVVGLVAAIIVIIIGSYVYSVWERYKRKV